MNQKYDGTVQLTAKEYAALMNIRGLKANAHMMVMAADISDNGNWTLEGSRDDFDALLCDLEMEIVEGMAHQENWPTLRRIMTYITAKKAEIPLSDMSDRHIEQM